MSKNFTASELKEAQIKKTWTEEKIIEAMSVGKVLSDMDDDGLRYVADQILLRGAAMYGCGTPETELFAAVVSSQITNYLLEFGYENLTIAEIILAFQMNLGIEFLLNPLGENIKAVVFSGKFIHLSFVASILKNYSVLKNNLISKYRNHLNGY